MSRRTRSEGFLHDREYIKRYESLFTCLVSRAVHIETAACSLDTDSFIHALRRSIIAHRDQVRQCDGLRWCTEGAEPSHRRNGPWSNPGQTPQRRNWLDLQSACCEPHGRRIRTIRKVLSNRLDDESLRTLLCEVEAKFQATYVYLSF